MSSDVQDCLRRWGVHHRLSSAYFPHSNCRAELAVKTGKRMLRDNMSAQGKLNTDKIMRARMQYHNTPISDIRWSPAQIVFNRQLRDFIPVPTYKYRPSQEWVVMNEDRERAMAARRVEDGTRLARYTKQQKELPVGTAVAVQNQTGKDPTKWDKTGVVLENKKHSQVLVRMDGSRRATLRNRRFVKQILQPARDRAQRPVQMIDQPRQQPGQMEDHQDAGQKCVQEEIRQTPDLVRDQVRGVFEEVPEVPERQMPDQPAPPPTTQELPMPSSAPMPSSPLPPTAASRPRREPKPNPKYSPELYDLSKISHMEKLDDLGLGGLEEDSPTLSRQQVIDMFKFINDRLPEHGDKK